MKEQVIRSNFMLTWTHTQGELEFEWWRHRVYGEVELRTCEGWSGEQIVMLIVNCEFEIDFQSVWASSHAECSDEANWSKINQSDQMRRMISIEFWIWCWISSKLGMLRKTQGYAASGGGGGGGAGAGANYWIRKGGTMILSVACASSPFTTKLPYLFSHW